MYSIQKIADIISGRLVSTAPVTLTDLIYDSRRIQHPAASLFFAIITANSDGHQFINDAYKKGVRTFVVSKEVVIEDAAVIVVSDTLTALQSLAAYHRKQFGLPVIGITGSNGKTIVKEWLNALLEADYRIVRSPKSFNSQIGVPVSVWEINAQHTLGIFEAGISQRGEMEKLEKVIQPTIGVLTNIGEAHSEGFASSEAKLSEKLKLFTGAEIVIGEAGLVQHVPVPTFTWSYSEEALLKITSLKKAVSTTTITAWFDDREQSLTIPFTDEASIQNAITCWCVLLYLKLSPDTVQERFLALHPIDMRLQLAHGINDCLIINDSYSADPTSLKIALDFLAQQSSGLQRTVILSDFFESGKEDDTLYQEIAALLNAYGIKKLIAIGDKIARALIDRLPAAQIQSYANTKEFIIDFKSSGFAKEVILIKGARRFGFERIALLFEEKLHGTVLQINLSALLHNLKEYQKHLKPPTKIMAMVKAFAYGSGGAEIASVLQFHNVAYLAVAYADEGIELVKAGIAVPIMVMNAERSSFAAIIEHNLQPVLYSPALLQSFETYVKEQGVATYPVHIEIETGMNRLGFSIEETEAVAAHLSASPLIVQSLFSHLAASEERGQDGFTAVQADRFNQAAAIFQQHLSYSFLKHISNSAAIIRHPQLQMDMVRLGIGLYGIEPDAEEVLDLETVATLRSTIAQIKEVKAGESVGYNRRGMVARYSRIATVRIGYADGYSRRFSNGAGKMLVQGRLAPVIGSVCMDMTMIDITDIEGVAEGDDVIIFGAGLPVQDVAQMEGTIAYEIMTSVSQRVKRVYYYE